MRSLIPILVLGICGQLQSQDTRSWHLGAFFDSRNTGQLLAASEPALGRVFRVQVGSNLGEPTFGILLIGIHPSQPVEVQLFGNTLVSLIDATTIFHTYTFLIDKTSKTASVAFPVANDTRLAGIDMALQSLSLDVQVVKVEATNLLIANLGNYSEIGQGTYEATLSHASDASHVQPLFKNTGIAHNVTMVGQTVGGTGMIEIRSRSSGQGYVYGQIPTASSFSVSFLLPPGKPSQPAEIWLHNTGTAGRLEYKLIVR